jgi:hypothetical protein
MDKKTFSIILSVAIIIGFFLPYIISFTDISGFNAIFGKEGMGGIESSSERYLWLMIPIPAILILFGSFTNDSFMSSRFLFWVPLLMLLFIAVRLYFQAKGQASAIENATVSMSKFIGIFGYGYWLSLFAAILLPFSKEKN